MKEYQLSINNKNQKQIISRDETEFIHLKFGSPQYRTNNECYYYRTDESCSYCIICDGITGEVIADLLEDDYLMYQDEFEYYCTSKYRRCA